MNTDAVKPGFTTCPPNPPLDHCHQSTAEQQPCRKTQRTLPQFTTTLPNHVVGKKGFQNISNRVVAKKILIASSQYHVTARKALTNFRPKQGQAKLFISSPHHHLVSNHFLILYLSKPDHRFLLYSTPLLCSVQ
jgi:hypothetical protein